MTIFRSRFGFAATAPLGLKLVFFISLASAVIGIAESGLAEILAHPSAVSVLGREVPIVFHGDKIVYVSQSIAWHYSGGLRFFFIGWLCAAGTLAFGGMAGHLELKESK